jgi:hypothetical protein
MYRPVSPAHVSQTPGGTGAAPWWPLAWASSGPPPPLVGAEQLAGPRACALPAPSPSEGAAGAWEQAAAAGVAPLPAGGRASSGGPADPSALQQAGVTAGQAAGADAGGWQAGQLQLLGPRAPNAAQPDTAWQLQQLRLVQVQQQAQQQQERRLVQLQQQQQEQQQLQLLQQQFQPQLQQFQPQEQQQLQQLQQQLLLLQPYSSSTQLTATLQFSPVIGSLHAAQLPVSGPEAATPTWQSASAIQGLSAGFAAANGLQMAGAPLSAPVIGVASMAPPAQDLWVDASPSGPLLVYARAGSAAASQASAAPVLQAAPDGQGLPVWARGPPF